MARDICEYWDVFLAAAAEPEQPAAMFRELERIACETVGTRLFTAMTFDAASGMGRRSYSGNEAAYPTGGFKPISIGIWSQTVLEQRRPFASLTIEEVAAVFPDWPLIQSLGCESGCNIPVVVADRVLGTLNLLDVAGHYTAERVAEAMKLRPFAAIAFLAEAAARRIR
ncbi:GAF domain-containing protein [Kaistia algarum]|uniref:GAF domain-containing protein n=1 Tax=Kaistia algarum TaxID=2083279 RepID=UPI000CE879A8|nr:GAF domain-containing protein [Kaistia algarum]MCX5514697.1 GAF domain-containing protein [Kaistia algarum]PPE78877.1 GAF domain-containing protein [Kaistia algarum]